jgi:site-specific DNA-methyltransferase (adenine-specific)
MVKDFENGKLYKGDCLEIMKELADKTVDMILCDLPYGTTACKWDTIIPFEPLWEQYERIIKDNGAIVLTASQPFTSALIMSNPKLFKYTWVWKKTKATGHLNAKKMPMKNHEDVCVFGKGIITYIPQGTVSGVFKTSRKPRTKETDYVYGEQKEYKTSTTGSYPKTVIEFANPSGKGQLHPTQKPVPLFEYFISTYTEEGDIVLDNCSGSGTTGIAAINTNRNFILIEQDGNFFDISSKRIEEHIESQKGSLF